MTNENNFLQIGDVSVGGRKSHSELIRIMKEALEDRTIRKFLRTSFKRKAITSTMND